MQTHEQNISDSSVSQDDGFVTYEGYASGKSKVFTPIAIDDNEELKEQLLKEEQYGLNDVAKFPTDIFPKPIREFIKAQAKALQVPEDFVAIGVLCAVSTVIGNTIVIKIKNSWTESGAIWLCIIGDPSVRKTAGLNAGIFPLRTLETQLNKDHESKLAHYKQNYEQHKIDLDRWKADVKKGNATIEDMPEEPVKPVLKRIIVNKTTMEGLYKVLESNPEGVIKFNDELKSMFNEMNQYRAGDDRQTWLEIYNQQPITVDRASQEEPKHIKNPFVTICGSTQPKTAESIIKDGQDDGLSARFLFSHPDTEISNWTDYDVNQSINKSYEDIIHNLYWSRPKEKLTQCFSPEAYTFFKSAINGLRAEMNQPDFPNELVAPYGKLEGYLARFTLNLHALAYSCNEADSETIISEDIIVKAFMLLEYFISHMRKVYRRTGENVQNRNCVRLVELVKKKGKKTNFGYELTFREIQRSNIFGKGKTTTDAIFEVVNILKTEGVGNYTMKEVKGQIQYKFILYL